MRLPLLKPFLASILALALPSIASATDFFDSTLTLQGKTLDLGEAGRTTDYAVFVTNGTFNASNSFTGDLGKGGNIGVNGNNLKLNGSTVNGDPTLRTGGAFNVPAPSKITGSRFQSATFDAKLSAGTSAANTFGARAASLSATTNYTSSAAFSSNLTLNNSSLTITASDSNPVVLKLQNFSLNTGTFTLVGTAMSKFIIDVDQSINLNSSSIKLSGGLLAGNVVFNIVNGNANFNNSQASGILLATNAGASFNNSTLTGELIAQVVNLNNGSRVKKPVRPSL